MNFTIRRYAPVPDSTLIWARYERLFIDGLRDGWHAHAFRNKQGKWEVNFRDVQKGRITGEMRTELNKMLAEIE